MAQKILEVTSLTKKFKTFTAVDRISFNVAEGEIVGLLGPNGAGKTTTMQMLLGLITPTFGNITYFGKAFPKQREFILSRINFASSYTELQHKLTVEQNLRIYAALYEISDANRRIEELLSILGVSHVTKTLFWRLSSGEKTRVILVKALLNRPQLLLMDEPTASLDPEIAHKVQELIKTMQETEKVAILYTSHDMEEVERLCDRVLFLHHGKIVAEDTPLGLTKLVGNTKLIITFDGDKEAVIKYLNINGYTHSFPRNHMVTINIHDNDVPKALFGLSKVGVWMTDIAVEKPDLEDVFLSIAKGEYEERAN